MHGIAGESATYPICSCAEITSPSERTLRSDVKHRFVIDMASLAK
jgi:hypothetical protein